MDIIGMESGFPLVDPKFGFMSVANYAVSLFLSRLYCHIALHLSSRLQNERT